VRARMASPASELLPVLHGFLSMVPSATLFGRLKDADPEWATTDGQQRLVRDVLRHPRAISMLRAQMSPQRNVLQSMHACRI
jgi:hypothetical protein